MTQIAIINKVEVAHLDNTELFMFKKIFISTFILGSFLIGHNIANAQDEFFIKKEMLSKDLILHEPMINNSLPCVHTPCAQDAPCPDSFYKEAAEAELPCSNTPCDIQKNCPDGFYKEAIEKTLPCSNKSKCLKMKKFEELDEKLALSDEQKIQAKDIRKAACAKIKPLKTELINKKTEVTTLQRTKMSQIEIDKRTKILNKEIKALEKEIKALKKSADAEFKGILTTQQKRAYSALKKEIKLNTCPCDCENCDCKNCNCENCDCKNCDCTEENNCGCIDNNCPCEGNCDCKKPCDCKN